MLELIHTDVCGPSPISTTEGKRYFVSFIDDYSRKATVFLLQRKNEVVQAFQSYIKEAERQTGCKIKRIRSDNGLEFCN